jgi:hypothetical protein
MKTCFISAPVNIDLSVLRSVLQSKNIRAIMPFELEITGSNFREQIETAIRKADFFVAVLTKESSANVFFELGYDQINFSLHRRKNPRAESRRRGADFRHRPHRVRRAGLASTCD